MITMKRKYFVIFIFFLILTSFSFVQAVPVDWWGKVTVDSNTSTDGAIVAAYINNGSSANATDTVGTPDTNYYLLHVECSDGDNVSFKVFGVDVNESAQSCTGFSNELNLSMSTLADGNLCTYDQGCGGGFCVHGVCRSASTFCGDDFCDSGESCSSDNSACSSGFACTNGCVASGTGNGGGGDTPAEEPPVETPGEDVPVSETVIIESVSAGETVTVNFEDADELGVDGLTIKFTNDVQDVSIEAIKQITRPSGVTTPPGIVNKYITITVSNVESGDLESATINFKTEQSWVSDNNIDKNTVILRRFTNQWSDLTTTLTNEDVNFVFYEAQTPGFSVFAVIGEQIVTPPSTPVPPPPAPVPVPVPATTDYSGWWIIGIIVIIIVAILIAIFLRKK